MKFLLTLLLYLLMPGNGIQISDAWLRPGAEKMGTALYFTIENETEQADTLYNVTCDFAGRVEIHETYDSDGMKGMRKINNLVIDPKSGVSLKPGSYHVMVMKLKKVIKKGDKEDFTLFFSKAGEIKITAEVR